MGYALSKTAYIYLKNAIRLRLIIKLQGRNDPKKTSPPEPGGDAVS